MDIAQVPLGRIISGSFVTITLGMHDPREPERARKGPKGPDEASFLLSLSFSVFALFPNGGPKKPALESNLPK